MFTWRGLVGRFSSLGKGVEAQVRLTGAGSVAVANVESPDVEVARAGRRFYGGTQALGSGIASVTAIPTTAAAHVLFNGETGASSRTYVIRQVSYYLASGATAAGSSLLYAVSKTSETKPSAAASYSTQSISGSSSASSKAVWGTAVTLGSTPTWGQLAGQLNAGAANVGQSDQPWQSNGLILIPPGFMLALTVLNTNTTGVYCVSVIWDELDLDLE